MSERESPIENAAFRGLFLDVTDGRACLVQSRVKELPLRNTLIRVEFAAFTEADASQVSGLSISGARRRAASWRAVAGVTVASKGNRVRSGERVVVTCAERDGTGWLGCSEYLSVSDSSVARLPVNVTAQSAALVGHPGFIAMLCVCALEDSGVTPDKGPVLVTEPGSTMGRAVQLILDRLGYRTIAAPCDGDCAIAVATRHADSWAAVVDTMGGRTLSVALHGLRYGGVAVVAGAADDGELKTSLRPFLFGAVRLVGVDAETTPALDRDRIWRRIAVDYPITSVDLLAARTVRLDELGSVSREMVEQKQQGRVVVDLRA